jgi:8-oxo-dGTP pyrophosphatase MutT (NUDIX family)
LPKTGGKPSAGSQAGTTYYPKSYPRLVFLQATATINQVMKTYCIAIAVIWDGNKYFIAKRAKTKKIAPAIWEFVTGFVEDHEAAEDTILREVREEVNAAGVIVRELPVLQMTKGDERWIIIPFLMHLTGDHPTTDPAEHSASRWVTWEELEAIPVNEFRYNIDQLRRALIPAAEHQPSEKMAVGPVVNSR